MWKTVIVTGGAGFIGSHLVDALAPLCDRLVVIDDDKVKADRKSEAAKYKLVDVRDKAVVELIEKEKPEVIFHLAAHMEDRVSIKEPVMNAEHNIIGTLNVLEGARRAGAKRLVLTSTGVVYGQQKERPIKESAELCPVTPYAVSKLTCERYLHVYREVHGLSSVALRCSNVYGPRQDTSAESGAIGIFARALLKGKPTFMNNDGLTTRDYIFVDDVVQALIKAAKSDFEGEMNVSTGIETTTEELFELVRTSIGVEAKPEVREEVLDHPKFVSLNPSKVKKELQWKPEVKLKDGVDRTVDWFRGL